jgi:hypothetical protein
MKGRHRHLGGNRGGVADVIRVVVRDQQEVEALELRLLDRGEHAIEVAIAVAGKAGVDQHRLAGRRHEQCGLPAFYVDE